MLDALQVLDAPLVPPYLWPADPNAIRLLQKTMPIINPSFSMISGVLMVLIMLKPCVLQPCFHVAGPCRGPRPGPAQEPRAGTLPPAAAAASVRAGLPSLPRGQAAWKILRALAVSLAGRRDKDYVGEFARRDAGCALFRCVRVCAGRNKNNRTIVSTSSW